MSQVHLKVGGERRGGGKGLPAGFTGMRHRTRRAAMLAAALCVGVASAALAEEPAIPAQPTDPVAAKAYGVFDQTCSGCHQVGKLKNGRQPGGALGNILDLTALARNSALIAPGNADASPLYTAMQSRAMPIETPGETPANEITATELASVRDWIEQLPVSTGCVGRSRVTAQAVADTVGKAVAALAAPKAVTARYISLAPLYNSCATPDEIEGARQGISLLMNSLSLALEPVKPRALEPDGLVLEIDLATIGWSAATWERVARSAPIAPFIVFDAATQAATGTHLPLVNGDWLADITTRASIYYDLIGVPETLPALLTRLRIDLTDTKRGAADRIGLRTSQVARGNRLIERRSFPNGAAWLSSEFAPTAGRPDMFDLTIAAARGPTAVTGDPLRTQVPADVTLVHFDLPNGFPAYFIANPAGARINDVPLSVLKDDSHPSSKVTTAQSCLGCHGASPVALARGRADDLKARLAGEATLSKEARDRFLALHPEPAELQRRIDDDRSRFLRVTAVAGVEPQRLVDGVELLPALIARYRRDVTAAEMADLVDMEPGALFDLGKTSGAALADVLERLKFGPVPRGEVDAVLPEVAARRGLRTDTVGGIVVPPPIADGAGPLSRLVLKAERPKFQTGDLLTMTARANASCYLTVLSVDARGRGTVLYPNEFEPNNFVEVGKEIRLPGEKAPYQFRLRDKGQESLIGICTTTAKSVDGIHHDFEKQRFTVLGDYRAFLNRNWGLREPSESKSKPKAGRRATDAPAPDVAAKPDIQARTAIRITIE